MSRKSVKIVADSSSDLFSLDSLDFETAPLKIITASKEYTDDPNLDVKGMVDELSRYKGKSSTSCPNAGDWLKVFGDAKEIFCFTITATLSGSYNAACLARQEYEVAHPDRKVFVLNTLTTGPEMALLIEKTRELVLSGAAFEQITEAVTDYRRKTGLIFMLQSMRNLANNGRVSPLVAKAAGLLGIRVVGKASERGDLQQLAKCRGEEHALENIVLQMEKEGYNGGKIRIAHCFNEDAANKLSSLLLSKYLNADIRVYRCAALCSFYAEMGGLLIGFEK